MISRRAAIAAALLFTSAALAAPAEDFYIALLQRGIADVARGAYVPAINELRIAAFGLLDDLPRFQTAEVYLTVALLRVDNRKDAAAAAEKVLQAEKLSPRTFDALSLEETVRAEFHAALPTLVRAEALAAVPSIKGAAPPVEPRIAAAEKLIDAGHLPEGKQQLLEVARLSDLTRPQLLQIAAGLSRAAGWRESSEIYRRAAPFREGEAMHMFRESVNRYELGEREAARELFHRAVPSLPQTQEVMLYRTKIEGTP
jgi:hypothetical protein